MAARLQNRTAVVTGGSHGIGQAIAEIFAEEGAHVFILDIDSTAGEQTVTTICQQGNKATLLQCDVASAEQVVCAVEKVIKAQGRIDVLCNNAAYIRPDWHNAADASDDEWEKCLRVSLMGTVNCTRAVVPTMIEARHGSIINISSVQGLVAGRNSAAYTTIKHSLIGFTRSVACDYGSHQIRCNAICPGAITTRVSPPAGSELYHRQIGKTFLGRIGKPREVAGAALFLASDEASYITGAILAVDGGWTAT